MSRNRAYPSDITDAEWDVLEALVPAVKPGGRPAKHDRRVIVDAIFYVNRTGCSWRSLPIDFPHWMTVYRYFRDWKQAGVYIQLNEALRGQVRRGAGRNPVPTAVISQSVKTSERGGQGVRRREGDQGPQTLSDR
ncbi:transposase [Deinococcus sp.]|uniref:transposase n=1 Tax=Deinococcus sp. TaxID=47478 RepID=UPI003C7ECAB6